MLPAILERDSGGLAALESAARLSMSLDQHTDSNFEDPESQKVLGGTIHVRRTVKPHITDAPCPVTASWANLGVFVFLVVTVAP